MINVEKEEHLLTSDRSINGNQYGGYLKTKQNKKKKLCHMSPVYHFCVYIQKTISY